jgi:DNA-binding transcriptional ArsR family regulator
MKILSLLAKKQSYPKEISSQLRENEQKIYYHIRKLKKSGAIKLVRTEEHGGAVAKIYALTAASFVMRFRDFEKTRHVIRQNKFFSSFISDGRLKAKIAVGSPDPHGPEKARSRDAYYAVDLGLFIGTFLTNAKASVCLDTDMADMKENMIIVGGPVVNRITKAVNERMPIRFDNMKNIYSSLSKKTYKSDDCGMIVKMKNPIDETKELLVIAGKRYSGTRAAILAFLRRFDEIEKRNCHVVEGVDADFDGVVDDVRILE